jgi:hypothetical protein
LGEGDRDGASAMEDLTIVYYTCNYLEEKNPYFLKNCWDQLMKAKKDLPVVAVSQKPMDPQFYGVHPEITNLNLGDIGRSHLNIYWQILQGCKAAKTTWVAMAEDDILYSEQHFNPQYFVDLRIMATDTFLYDMNKVSLFTWDRKHPIFSFRSKRKVVNQLIAKRQMLIDAMEERFAKLPDLRKIWEERRILKYWGDPGRYESSLGVSPRETYEFFSWVPSIVFSHEYAYGYEFNQGKRKKNGDLRIVELDDWGKASDILNLYIPHGR